MQTKVRRQPQSGARLDLVHERSLRRLFRDSRSRSTLLGLKNVLRRSSASTCVWADEYWSWHFGRLQRTGTRASAVTEPPRVLALCLCLPDWEGAATEGTPERYPHKDRRFMASTSRSIDALAHVSFSPLS